MQHPLVVELADTADEQISDQEVQETPKHIHSR